MKKESMREKLLPSSSSFLCQETNIDGKAEGKRKEPRGREEEAKNWRE
jgi:hypothetical protein